MSLPFVVQQTLRLMNPPTSATSTTSSPSSPTSAAVAGAFASSEPNDPAAPPAAAKDFAGGDVDGLSGGGGDEAKAWGRLRDYEVEEAQTINHRLLARRQQQQTPVASSGDTFMPDGDLLFTDRYIQRFLEEEERTKRESADWTRNLDSSTARFRADAKERDPTTMPTTPHPTTTSHYDHYTENDEAEGYADVDYGDSGGDHGGASHHHHVGVRSSLSSVSRALGRKVKFSSSKIAASLGSRRIHRKDKGKEAATGRHHGYYADADYYGTTTAQHPLYDVADAGLLPAYVVPSGTAVPEAEPLFPLFNAGLAPAAARSSSAISDFEKTWGRDSPFSTYAFDQRPAAQPQQDLVNVFDSDDEGDGDLPALEHLNP